MKIIKEFHEVSNVCVVHGDICSKTLKHFVALFNKAAKDFPELKKKDVSVEYYASDGLPKTFAIEFHAPHKRISRLRFPH